MALQQLNNDTTPSTVNLSKSGGRGIVQAVVEAGNPASLYGSLNGTDYALINTFTTSGLIEIALPKYVLIGANTDATSQATANNVTGTTKVYIDETRG